jgi:cytochrome oxidase Cu insertion factor (SCO1/SenC/PrrC family)
MTKRIMSVAVGLFFAALFTLPAVQAQQSRQQKPEIAHTFLKVGDMAPEFTLRSDQGTTVTLSDYRGKKDVILAFYVLAFTGG